LVSGLVTAAFLFSGAVNVVLAVSALLMAANHLLMYASFVALRIREPDAPRPYRAFGAPYTTVAAFALGITFVVGVAISDPRNGALAFGVLLASYPIYRLTRRLIAAA
jgi:amino acid transporter